MPERYDNQYIKKKTTKPPLRTDCMEPLLCSPVTSVEGHGVGCDYIDCKRYNARRDDTEK